MDFKRKAGAAPEWYVPGLCRGAIGFITRSDLGPARQMTPENIFGIAPAGYVPGTGRGAIAFTKEEIGQTDRGDYSETQYDKWSGYQDNLFSNVTYGEDDEQADKEYERLDKYMDERRSIAREQRLKKEMEKASKAKPPVSSIFASCKKELANVKKEEWENLPEAVFHATKRKKYSRTMPIPDKILADALKDVQYATTVSEVLPQSIVPSSVVPGNLTELSVAKGQILNIKLGQAEDSVTGQSVVNRNSYLESLTISKPDTANFDISDLKKARLLMRSVINTKPNDSAGWIAAARIEEMDGRLREARNILAQGCESCPESDDIWLEAARLAPPDQTKAILAKAISRQPNSVKLWLAAANKETDSLIKSKILRRSLEFIPSSPILWKEAVKLEGPDEARELLRKAVECVPFSVDMWIALAKLESYDEARVVLNKAVTVVKNNHILWVHAAMLEEAQGQPIEQIDKKIIWCLKGLNKAKAQVSRETWLTEAVKAEQSGSVLTCKAIVKYTMELGLDKDDFKSRWLENADEATKEYAIETARTLYHEACNRLPKDEDVWIRAFDFEKQNGTPIQLLKLMEEALNKNKDQSLFWLIYAKQLWIQGDLNKCRETLERAKSEQPDKEDIILALIKLEKHNKNKERVIELVKEGRENIGSLKFWKESIMVEQALGHIELARSFLNEAVEKYPKSLGLWQMGIRLESEENNDIPAARFLLERAFKACGDRARLMISSADLDIKEEKYTKARTTLQEARNKYPDSEEVWLESIRLEKLAKNDKAASFLCASALQKCPKSGRLWSEAIFMEQPHNRKKKSMEAFTACEQDETVVVAIACMFYAELKVEKARRWFNRGTNYNTLNGDPWAYYYKFERSMETKQAEEVLKKCATVQPRKGLHWKSIARRSENWFLATAEMLEKVANEITFPS